MNEKKASQTNLWAVMPAAGVGTRMQQELAKQYINVGGKAIIEHSAAALLSSKRIKSVMVCLAQGDIIWPTLGLEQEARIQTTIGGATRAQSVLNGLVALRDANEHDWVLVHDAARPCLSAAMLTQLITQLENEPVGGILALLAKDTLKLARSKQKSAAQTTATIDKTLDRTLIWQAQTPQMFRYGLLKNALTEALQQAVEITDEASAIEWLGLSPKLVQGDARNLKVTTPEDLALAEFLLN